MAENEKVIITRVEFKTEKGQANLQKLTGEIEDNNLAVKRLQRQNKNLERQGERSGDKFKENANAIALLKAETTQLNAARRRSINTLNAEEGSMAEMKAQLAENAAAREDVNLQTAAGREEAEALNEEMLELTETLKEQEEAGGSFGRSVGNYAKGFEEAGEQVTAMSPALGSMAGGVGKVTAAFNLMLANPILLFLAAIVLAGAAMLSWMSRSEEGQEEMAAATAKVSAFFESFLDIVGALGKFMFTVIVPVLKLVVTNFMALFHAGQAVSRFFKGDFKGASESFNKSLDDLAKNVEIVTEAVDDVTEGFNEMTESMKETIETANEKSLSMQQLARDEFALGKATRENNVAEGARRLVIANALKDSRDLSRSVDQRLNDLAKATFFEQTNLDRRKALLEEELRIIKTRDAAYLSTAEGRKEVTDAERRLLDFQTQSVQKQEGIARREITLIREKEREEKMAFDAVQKRINDRAKARAEAAALKKEQEEEEAEIERIAEEERVAREKQAALDLELFRKERDALEIEDELLKADALIEIERFKLEQLLLNKELNDDERLLLAERTSLAMQKIEQKAINAVAKMEANAQKQKNAAAAAERKQRVDNINHYLSASDSLYSILSDQLGANADETKAVGIANALVNTYVGATAALALPYPASLAAFASVLATGLATVSKITSGNSGVNDGVSSSVVPTTIDSNSGASGDTGFIDNQTNQDEILANALGSINLNVSVEEITDTQDAVTAAEAESTLGG